MEVLNASKALTPKTLITPKKPQPIRTFLAKGAAFPLFLSNGVLALTYEEALNQTLSPSPYQPFDLGSFLQFGSDNAAIIAAGAAVIAVPVIVSRIFGKKKGFGVESAKNAFLKLGEEGAELVDIREVKEVREKGAPDLRKLKKKAVSVVYKGEDKNGFLEKLNAKFKDPANTTLFILDKFDGNSELVAELVTANGFKAAYAIKDGAEGPRGWLNSELPWSAPKKILALDFGGLNDFLSDTFGENSALPALGLAAATGLGFFTFTETETILQLLGSAAIVQFATKKLLFAKDRRVTLQQADEFLNTKIAPKELVDEIKMIGKALLPVSTSVKSLPSPPEAAPEPSTPAISELKADVTETKPEIVEETPAEPAPVVNSVPKDEEVKEEVLAGFSRALSPYPYYPDFKPPSSPSPSKP